VSRQAQQDLLDEVARGAYRLESFDLADIQAARQVLAKYPDLELGLADASLVVLAARHRVRDILTLGATSTPCGNWMAGRFASGRRRPLSRDRTMRGNP
jgi:hypothetical protein